MKRNIIKFFLFLSLVSCHFDTKKDTPQYQCPMQCEGEKTYSEPGKCPMCDMSLIEVPDLDNVSSKKILPSSIFNLNSKWHTQNNKIIELKDLKGRVLVVSMIYTSCKAACPRLVSDMISINKKIGRKDVTYVLVSMDPKTDTPERLKAYAKEYQIDNSQWVFLQGTLEDVRDFSNVLAVKYKQISPLLYSHSSIISVFNKEGVLAYQREGLGANNTEIIENILNLTSKK